MIQDKALLPKSDKVLLTAQFLIVVFVLFVGYIPTASHSQEVGEVTQEDLRQVDVWWAKCSADQIAPNLEEFLKQGPNEPKSVRALDLSLQFYLQRGQEYMAYKVTEKIVRDFPDTLCAAWCEACRTWLIARYGKRPNSSESVQMSLDAIPKDQAMTLEHLVRFYPEEMTGVVSLRLLFLQNGGEALLPGGALWVLSSWLGAEFPESPCAAFLSVERGSVCANQGDVESACRLWAEGLPNYPFLNETPRIRALLVDSLWKTRGGPNIPSLQSPSSLSEKELGLVVTAMLQVRQLKEATNDSRLAQARDILSKLKVRLFNAHDPSPFWLEIETEVEYEEARLRLREGSGLPQDQALDEIRVADESAFSEVLARGLKEYGENLSFARAAFWIAQQRPAFSGGKLADICWLTFATTDCVDCSIRLLAYQKLIETRGVHLNLLRVLQDSSGPLAADLASTFRRSFQTRETRLLDAVQNARGFLLQVPLTPDVLDLADMLYVWCLGIGVRNLPGDLYVELAVQASEDVRLQLAARAEKAQRLAEAARIYEMVESAAQDRTSTDNQDNTVENKALLNKRIQILLRLEKYSDAAKVAVVLAERAAGSVEEVDAWLRVAQIHFDGRDFRSALDVLQSPLFGGDSNALPNEFGKLLAQTYYRLGKYDDSFRVVDQLQEKRALTSDEESQFSLMRAYGYLYQRKYQDSLDEFKRIANRYSYDSRKERQIQEVIRQLESVGSR